MNLQELPPFNGDIPGWIIAVIKRVRENNLILKGFPTAYVLREQGTGIKFNGNEVFQKTVALTEAFCKTNNTAIAHGISGFSTLVKAEAAYSDNGKWFCLPRVGLSLSNVEFTSVTGSANTLTMAAGDPVALGLLVDDVVKLTGTSADAAYTISAFGGTSNRALTVAPDPGTFAADTSFTLTRVLSSDFKVDATNITSVVVGGLGFTSWANGYITLWYTKT